MCVASRATGASLVNAPTECGGEQRLLGIVIVTHGGLADALLAATENILGPQRQMCAVGVADDDNLAEKRAHILAAARIVDDGSGVVIFTDLIGGTPSNLAIWARDRANAEVIAGVNLPMIVKLTSEREKIGLADAVEAAQEAGRKYLRVAVRPRALEAVK